MDLSCNTSRHTLKNNSTIKLSGSLFVCFLAAKPRLLISNIYFYRCFTSHTEADINVVIKS